MAKRTLIAVSRATQSLVCIAILPWTDELFRMLNESIICSSTSLDRTA
jgi:hypothetical protein